MNHPIIPIAVLDASRQRKRQAPKGRRVDAAALAQVQQLLGAASRQPDLLIEHLHKIQDRFGHLSAAHLAALAQEMRLAGFQIMPDALLRIGNRPGQPAVGFTVPVPSETQIVKRRVVGIAFDFMMMGMG